MLPTQSCVWPWAQAGMSAGWRAAWDTMPDLRVMAQVTNAAVATASAAMSRRRRAGIGRKRTVAGSVGGRCIGARLSHAAATMASWRNPWKR